MAPLLLILVFGLSQEAPPGEAACDHVLAQADSAYAQLLREARPPEILDRLAAQSRAARLCYDGGPTERTFQLYTWEGHALSLLGRDDEALELAEEFFNRFAGATRHLRDVAFMYRLRGELYWRSGRLGAALRDFTQAVDHAPDSLLTAKASYYRDVGRAYQRLGGFDLARQYYTQAEQALRRALDSRERGTRRTLAAVLLDQVDLTISQGENLEGTGDRLALAEAQAREAAALYRALGEDQYLSYAYLNLADVQKEAGETDEALKSIHEALRLSRRFSDVRPTVGATYRLGLMRLEEGRHEEARHHLFEALALAEGGGLIDYQRLIRSELGALHELQGDLDGAERWYRRAIETTEGYRASLGTTRWAALAFGSWQRPYRALVRVLLAQGRPEAAFLVLGRTRARHLRELRLQAWQLADAGRAPVDSLRRELDRVREQLRTAPAGPDVRALHNRETSLEVQLATAVNLDASPDTLSLEALRDALAQRDQVLLSYFIEDAPAGAVARSHVFVVTADTLVALPLPEASVTHVLDALHAVSPLLTGPNVAPTINAKQFSLAALGRLYDLLYAPAARLVPEDASLVFLPDGPLYTLPFGALVEAPHPAYAYGDAPYLIRKHPVSVELSASLLAEEPPPVAARPLDVAAFGRSRFGGEVVDQFRLPDLPSVQTELGRLGKLFRHAYVALEGEATEAAFSTYLDEAHVLHFASHALVHPSSPLYSSLILAPTSGEGADDGVVHLYELQKHALSTPLVVLSGCNTARGVQHAGEGPESLQYAFRALGAQSALSTLWLADDEATTQLMLHFYRGLRRGLSKDVALQQAQLRYLEGVEASPLASPFFWATPVLYGPADPIPLKAPHRTALWMGFFVVVLVIGGWLLVRQLKRPVEETG